MSAADPTHQLAEALQAGGPTLVLTGAGVSLASGIPTFRGTDAGAVWASNVMARATLQHFEQDPADSWAWYRARHAGVLAARPNAAHRALVDLERWHAARGARFQLITQNIDVLHEAAGMGTLIKVHGSIDRARCADASCAGSETTVATGTLDFSAFDARPTAASVPRCAACGALMRPHVLWFDEHYGSHPDYGWPAVLDACEIMRLVIAIGTSFSVGVTDLVASEAGRRGVPLFVIDPHGASIAGRRVIGLRDKAEDLLPRVCALVGAAA
ncbi:MAG: Sir2 family NAD-dependent protein deacetylase [Vicinamibacteraceae bacterium]